MSLPKIEMPSIIFDCTLPVSKQTVSFTPYLVEDEKGFLSAGKSKDMSALIQNYDNVIEPKILTPDFKLKDLCLIDYIYLCVFIRCKSKDEIYTGRLKECQHCKKKNIEFEIDIIDSLKFTNSDVIKGDYVVNDRLILQFSPLKRSFLLFGDQTELDPEGKVELFKYTIAHSVNMVIYDGKPYKDFEIQEIMTTIISKLSTIQIKDIFRELSKMIRLQCELNINCPQCKKTNTLIEHSFLQFLK